jgi:hypothetical protein
MKKLLPVLLLGLALPDVSDAGGFEAKTMREPLSSREVERPILLPKGWLELGLTADMKQANSEWGPDGDVIWFDGADDADGTTTTFLYTTETLSIRYGVAQRAELFWHLPFHYLKLTNPALGTDTSGLYMGDPKFGVGFSLFGSDAPLTSVVARMELKAPAGNETPGSYIAGPSTYRAFITSTGTPDLRMAVEGKRQFGIFGVHGAAGYLYRFSGVAQYILETEFNQFNGRIKPGAQVYANVGGQVQAGPVNLNGTFWFENHGATRIGTTSAGLFPDNDLQAVAGSDGYSYGVDAGAVLNATKGFDLVFNANIPLRGEDLMFFPIEDLHPTRGITYTGGLELRY